MAIELVNEFSEELPDEDSADDKFVLLLKEAYEGIDLKIEKNPPQS